MKTLKILLMLSIVMISVSCKKNKKSSSKEPIKTVITIPELVLNKQFLGDWFALSKNHMSISGNMQIRQNEIEFSKKGIVTFKILKQSDDMYILELDKIVDSGNFMRIGPISKKNTEYTQMEVAYYQTKEKAFLNRENSMDNADSWGLYYKN